MSLSELSGGCLCGGIRYRLAERPLSVIACHCTQCRRQSGSAFSVNLIIRASALTVEGTPSAWLDHDTASGDPLAREHCGDCGAPIRSVPSGSPKLIALKAGSLDEPLADAPGMHIWTRSKLPWVTIPDCVASFEMGPELQD